MWKTQQGWKLGPVTPGFDLGAFQSRQPELHINFPVSLVPKSCHQPYLSQSIVTCMPQFPDLLKCWKISGKLVSVSDRNVTCMPICPMNLYENSLLLKITRGETFCGFTLLSYLFWCYSHYSSRHLGLMFNAPIMHVC